MSKECPEGFLIPRAELLSINLVDGVISFKTQKYLYNYYFNKNKLCLINLKTGNKLSRDFIDASLEHEYEKDFEKKVFEDLGVSAEMSDPKELKKAIEEVGIHPKHSVIYTEMEQLEQSEDDE